MINAQDTFPPFESVIIKLRDFKMYIGASYGSYPTIAFYKIVVALHMVLKEVMTVEEHLSPIKLHLISGKRLPHLKEFHLVVNTNNHLIVEDIATVIFRIIDLVSLVFILLPLPQGIFYLKSW